MSDEQKMAYLYFLTFMYAGDQEKWQATFDAWKQFSINVGNETYERVLKHVEVLQDKYKARQ